MRILAIKPGHDGHVACLEDGRLAFSIEAEKDSGPRYGSLKAKHILKALELVDGPVDVFAVSGWSDGFRPFGASVEAGYFGHDESGIMVRDQRFAGNDAKFFSSSHERSHLIGCHAMSPWPDGQPYYALVWEGVLGSFYRIDETLKVEKLGTPLTAPGHRYSFLYGLADPALPIDARAARYEDAGKLMALASYGEAEVPTPEQADLIGQIFSAEAVDAPLLKAHFADSRLCNIGLASQEFRDMAGLFQQAIFDRFHAFAKANMGEGLPLLISGGCGLNCDWNSAWETCGLFDGTFVQPCANDSGSAIGTAADAQQHFSGSAKIDWTVYAGEPFVMDGADLSGFSTEVLDDASLCEALIAGEVHAWVQGRYEIGPRALGNRSLIAAPFTSDIHRRLNAIKQREGFRPIAPICMEEEIDRLFHHHGPSPYMLYFQRVKTDRIRAVTHVDGSARLQSVNRDQNPRMHKLLSTFKAASGTGCLCNTSLNFKGTGFINRMSDLVVYARDHGLDGFAVGETWYRRR